MSNDRKGKFLRVKCLDCDNEQIVFDHAASTVKCIICGKTMVESTGGKSKITAHIAEVVK
ncbi:30S ribosomal protein S27e [Methanobrevibacter filiformis]|uniref:Small ribosomal subunit protein eS27 n=1 Tax=Methanobrevibacter filiformis TaxID=55758 RepID=A0A162FKI9_9EURY|nr:30S ribosomal protein S27e [Methanobrevibacter filiformis]KZX11400.1 30S ribosomal protein S27e [Methanobrevibacter filiformis]